jgi:ABC-type transport system substrate-binding protein
VNELIRSTIGIIAILAILALTIVNTCQLDNLERQMMTGAISIGTRDPASAPTPSGDVVDPVPLVETDPIVNAPGNRLVPAVRAWANAPHVEVGTLRFETGVDPPGLNRLASKNAADMREIYLYVGNYLARRHPENPDIYGPELGINLTESDDGLTYTIHVRKGVLWHEPTVDWASGRYEWLRGPHELVADDFVFGIEVIQNPDVGGRAAAIRNYFEALDHVEVIDDHTFALHFKEKLYSHIETFYELEPFPRWLYMYDEDGKQFSKKEWGKKLNEHWYNQRAIGTGPYRFVKWDPGVRITMERNPDYFGEKPAFERLEYNIIKDQVSWPRRLKTKELDITRVQPEQYRTEILQAKGPYLGDPRIQFATYPETSYFYIGWNQDRPWFKDPLVRRAMTAALNRPAILESVFHGLGALTTGPFPQQSPCYDKSIEAWPYDLAAAAVLLDQAGWVDSDGDGIRDKVIDGTNVSFAFQMVIYGSSTEWDTIANIYREALMSIGVKMDPVALEWSTHLQKVEDRDFDAVSLAWVPAWEADLMQIWHSQEADRPKSSNRIGFRNKDADRIAEALRREFDQEKRVELCHEFHALVHELQPYTFVYQRHRAALYWDYVNKPEFSLVPPIRDARYWSFATADRP